MAGRRCHRCGITGTAPALDWSSTVEDGIHRPVCARCTRSHVRDIESKLSEQWWSDDARTVLVVEDDLDTRLVIRMSLELAGYVIDDVATGEQAVALLAAGHRPTAVVADVVLPGAVDGWEVRESVKAVDATTPVVMISAHWTQEDGHPRRDDVSFLAKPFDTDDLVAIVDERTSDQAGAGRA